MIEEHDFHYAMENTRVVVQPQRRIETFGSTVEPQKPRLRQALLAWTRSRVIPISIRPGELGGPSFSSAA